jgi:light-regulated signal transduction histidine kinase (bacteriophytochrome)
MRQAVGALYGQASPREALKAARLDLVPLDFDEFLFHVASNAGFAGIEDVHYKRLGRPVMVQADEFSLEDAVTHILRNADRHRRAGTPIRLSLQTRGPRAVLRIHNAGEPVGDALLERIFEYGVREDDGSEAQGRRGQGLFVARTYLAARSARATKTRAWPFSSSCRCSRAEARLLPALDDSERVSHLRPDASMSSGAQRTGRSLSVGNTAGISWFGIKGALEPILPCR